MVPTPLSSVTYVRRGMSLVEIVVAMGIFVFITAAILALVGPNYARINVSRQQTEAGFILQRNAGIVRNIAHSNFEKISCGDDPNAICHFSLFLNEETRVWELVDYAPSTPFDVEIIVSPLYRDAQGNPMEAGETPDAGSRFVDLRVSWKNDVGKVFDRSARLIVGKHAVSSKVTTLKAEFEAGGNFRDTVAVNELFNGEIRPRLIGDLYIPKPVVNYRLRTPEVPADVPVDIFVREDDLLVVTQNTITVFDLSNLTGNLTNDLEKYHIGERSTELKDAGIIATAAAMGKDRIYIGTSQGSVYVFNTHYFKAQGAENLSHSVEQRWEHFIMDDSQSSQAITRIVLDEDENHAYIGRQSGGSDGFSPEFLIVNLQATDYCMEGGEDCPSHFQPSANRPYVVGARHVGGTVRAIALGETFAYVASDGQNDKRIHVFDKESASPQSMLSLPASQTIEDIVVDAGYLYAGLSAHAELPELIRYQIQGSSLLTDGVLNVTDASNQPDSVIRVIPIPGKDWMILVHNQAESKMRVVRKAPPFLPRSDDSVVNMSSVPSLPTGNVQVTGANCRGVAYETNRIFFLCSVPASSGQVPRIIVVEGQEDPVGFPEWASYTSGSYCVNANSGDPFTWKHISYDASGLGQVELFIRTYSVDERNSGNGEFRFKPWIPVPAVGSTWHEFSSLPGFEHNNCMQYRIVFRPSQFCPVYVGSVIITHEDTP